MDNRKRLVWFEVGGLFFTLIIGTLLHFVYEWSGELPVVAAFSPINESTWEHLKMLFFPTLGYAIFEYFIVGKEAPRFWLGKAAGIVNGLVLIIVIFYTYSGILGTNYLFLDILTFLIAVVAASLISLRILGREGSGRNYTGISLFVLAVLLVLFVVFSYNPPTLNLFRDPVTGGYGIGKV